MNLWNRDLSFYDLRKSMKVKDVGFVYLNDKEKYLGVDQTNENL